MFRLLSAFTLLCMMCTPARAEEIPGKIPGADDALFILAFQHALHGNDPSALRNMLSLAERGNEAALRAMPALLAWMPPQGLLAAKRRFFSINGVPLEQAVEAASPVAAAWAEGRTDPAGPLDLRARQLAEAGESGKAQALYRAWWHRSFVRLPVSPETADPPPPLFMSEVILTYRQLSGNDPGDGLLLAQWLRENRWEAWLTMGAVFFGAPATQRQRGFMTAQQIVATAGIDPLLAGKKITEARALLDWYNAPSARKNPALAAAAATMMHGRIEFAPVAAFCHATCRATEESCEAAWLYLSAPYEVNPDASVPEAGLIAPNVFFATPRGASLIFPQATIGRMARAGLLERYFAPASRLNKCLVRAARASDAAMTPPDQ